MREEHEATKPEKSIEAVSAELLTIATIKEGMVIMGCVKEIKQTALIISLPGRMNGRIDVTSISDSYTNAVNSFVGDGKAEETKTEDDDEEEKTENDYKPLNQLFSIGQVVCSKVQSVEIVGSRALIALSLKPNDIHGEVQHTNVSKGTILTVAVAERGEHGYVIETGIKNLRGFLPDENTQKQRLEVGAVYFCRVKSVQSTSAASTAIFELTRKTTQRKLKENEEPNMDHMLPGTLVSFKITKVLKDGLQGSLFNGALNGYINEHQLGLTKGTNKFAEVKDFAKDTVLTARILYVMPLTKLVYLSLFTQDQFAIENDKLPIGKILTAKVSRIGTGGVILNLGGNSAKGVISLRSLKLDFKGNFDQDEVLVKFESGSEQQVRIMHYAPIDLLYVCTNKQKDLLQKYYTASDVSVGDYVEARFHRNVYDGRIEFFIGAIKAYIDPLYLSTATKSLKLDQKSKLNCRVISRSVQQNHVFLTDRKEFLDEAAPILTSFQNVEIGKAYLGVVKRYEKDVWSIEFFNYVRGFIHRKQLKTTELIAAEALSEGSIHKFIIKAKKMDKKGHEKLVIGLSGFEVRTGNVEKAKVSQTNENGMEVALLECNRNGFVPIMYLSDFPSLVHGIHRSFVGNENIKVIGASAACYSLRDVRCAPVKNWSQILPGDLIPAFIKDVASDVIKVQCLIGNATKDFTEIIHYKMFLENVERVEDINLVPDQKIFVKVLSRDDDTHSLTLSAQLRDVWAGDLLSTVSYFNGYFDDVELIKKSLKRAGHPICEYKLGEIVKATPTEESDPKEPCKMLIDGKVDAILTVANRFSVMGKKAQDILIVWIDYVNCVVYGTVKKHFLDRAKQKQDEKSAATSLREHEGLKADVALILDDLIVLYPRRFTNRFVFVPTRLHYNDFQPVIAKGIVEGALVNVSILDTSNGRFIGMFEKLYRCYETTFPKKLEALKRKAEETIKIEVDESMSDSGDVEEIESAPAKKKKKNLKKAESKNSKPKKAATKKAKVKIPQLDGVADFDSSENSSDDELDTSGKHKLPGVSNFWSNDLNVLNQANASSSDEGSEGDESSPAKKKKLSAQERFEQARIEEARIRAIEKSYAEDSVLPTTVDQFDRWLMAEPNNSRAWIQYMAFHVQATEIDRARAIAAKALKTINFRESQEILNIWAAQLNLELRFGNSDQFKEVLKESLQVNEPFKIYCICLQIYTDCKRVSELCDLILTVTKKFRQDPESWLKSAQAYFQVDLPDKAKALLPRALQTLPERERKSRCCI